MKRSSLRGCRSPPSAAATRRPGGWSWASLHLRLPPAVDATIGRDLVAALKARGRKVVLDASWAALRHAIEAAPDIVKPNIHELEELLGEPLPHEAAVVAAARRLLERGVRLVVVSMGRQGACFVTEDLVVTARPPTVVVKSTVGAGDAMVAGVVAAQLRGLPLATGARLATAFSLDAITRIGSGLSSPVGIERLAERVAVDEQRLAT